MPKALKRKVKTLLEEGNWAELLELLEEDRKVVPSLNRLLFHDDPLIRWRAVEGLGRVAARDPYALENIIGRLIYTMNDDSGQIGWMSPQALGEIAANDPDLVEDFFPIVISSIGVPDFSAGVCWAIGRVAEVRPDMAEGAGFVLTRFSSHPNPEMRGLACRALGKIKYGQAIDELRHRTNDTAELTVYEGGRLVVKTVGEMAVEALAEIE